MPIKTPGGILEVEDAKLRASYLLANTSVGIGTSTTVPDGASLYINEDNPTIRFQEGTTTSAARILAKSGTLRLESGTDYDQPDLTGDIAFSNIQGGTTHMIIKGGGNVGIGKESPSQMLDVSGNVQVGTANLFVDTTTGRVGVGVTDPGHNLDIVSEMNLRSVSNTASIKYNSNVVTEYVRSKKLIKYPRVAMTAATTSGYTASASDTSTGHDPWEAFDSTNTITTRWRGDGTNYASGVANTTQRLSASSGTPYGSWLKLHLPERIKLYKMRLNGASTQTPKKCEIWASNDDSTWTNIYNFNSGNGGALDFVTFLEFTFTPINDGVFEYYALIVTEVVNTSEPVTSIVELEYFGIPEYDPEAHGTDVIARSVPNVPNTDWLEVYYDAKDLSDGSISTVYDLKPSGTAVNGTVNGSVTVSNGTFTFPGSDDYISSVLGWSGDQPHSISFWINASHQDSNQTPVLLGTTKNANWANQFSAINMMSTGKVKWYFGNNDIQYNANWKPNTWIHFTFTYKGGGSTSEYKLAYINGNNLSVHVEPSASTPVSFNSGDTVIRLGGGYFDTIEEDFTGSIANFRLFNRALTADEVWQLYAYQKDYFQVSPDVVTFKGGRLGIGTSEPQAVLDVMGDVRYIRLTPRPAVSARQLFLNGTTQDGVYPISGVAGGTAYPIYCKMDPQHYGGFWMCFAQIPINTNGPINFFSDAYGNSGDLLATNLFSAPISILSNNAYGTDIDVLLELDGRGMRRTTGNKVGGIWRGIYLSQALDTSHVGTVSTSTHAYSDDGISWTNGNAATFTKANGSWNVAISTNGGGDYAYDDYNEAKGGWIIHGLSGYDLGCVYGRAMRGNDAINMGASTDWAVARIFVRPTQT